VLIDWFTVIAQAINFLVLIWLLKHFLYAPILSAMDRREKSVADRLKEADRRMAQAESEDEKYREEVLRFEQAKEDRARLVEEEIEKLRKDLLAEARSDAERFRIAWQDAMEREQKDFMNQLKVLVSSEIIRILRMALKDLTDEDLSKALVRVFTRRFDTLNDRDRARCAKMAQEEEIRVESSFDLEDSLKRGLTRVLRSVCGEKAEIKYETDTDMALGILVRIGGLRLSWGTEEYLDALERDVSDVITQVATHTPVEEKVR
jgi:F-type H+-transporting ATPase subunit b